MSKEEWWRGAVIYQVYPRSYCDTSGDGIGDLPGIITKLDYIASLGVDAIWISPFFKSPMKDFGYDISDYRDIDPIFGTMDDFRALVSEAHARGLKIILDQVWSHTSDQHDWFKESRMNKTNAKADWYIWADCKQDGTPPNNWLSIFGGPAWTWDTRREQYYLHHFLSSQPALNLWNMDVRQAILNTARYWLGLGVDGFRLDVINCALSHPELKDNPARSHNQPPPTDMNASNPMSRQIRENAYGYLSEETYQWLNCLRGVADEYQDIFLMGEIGGDNSERIAPLYTQTGKRLHSAYSFGLTGKTITKETILSTLTTVETTIKDGWMTYALGNHDNTRFASNHGQTEDVREDYAKMGMALLLSLRGSICIYEGEELGLPVAHVAFEDIQDPYDLRMYPDSMNRDGARTPMPWTMDAPQAGFSAAQKTWLPVDVAHYPLAVDQQESNDHSTLNHYRRFLKWRKAIPAMVTGEIDILDTPDGIVGFTRKEEDQRILCVFNTLNENAQSQIPSGAQIIEDVSRNIVQRGDALTLAPYGYAFFTI